MKPLAKTITHTLAVLGLAGAAVSPALAGTTYDGDIEHTTITVQTADLNLATARGQQKLDQRVEKAVREACRVTSPTTGSRILSQEARACLAKARAHAKLQVAALLSNEQRGG